MGIILPRARRHPFLAAICLALLGPGWVGDVAAEPDGLIDTIPFAEVPDFRRIVIDLAPRGQRPFPVLLDTGASHTIMTPRMARALGVSVRALKSSEYRKRTRLGRDLLFLVDTSSSDTGASLEYALVGTNFLSHFVVEIDYPGRVVRFFDPRRVEVPEHDDPPEHRVVGMGPGDGRPGVPIRIGTHRVRAVLDTGSPFSLVLDGDEARKAEVDLDALRSYGLVQTPAGATELLFHEAPDLRVAGFEFPEAPILVAPNGLYNAGGTSDSVLGWDLLRHFVIRLDYARRRVGLRRMSVPGVTLGGQDYAELKASWAAEGEASEEVAAGSLTPSRDREALRRDAEKRDREKLERFDREKSSRLYARTPGGGWVRVDGYRLRLGPKEGEVWYSFEKMQRIKVEEAASGH